MHRINAILFSIAFLPSVLFGHGDLHERIEHTTGLIKKYPDSAYLFLLRGELYAQHEEYNKALKDFEICRVKGYNNVRLVLNEATAHFDLSHYNKTLDITASILQSDTENVKAIRLRGLAYLKLNEFENAGLAFNKVIDFSEKTLPENYFEASSAWEQCQTDECHCQTTQVIYNGMDALGNLRGFYDRLIEVALNRNDFITALYYQTIVINQSRRKEWSLYDRGLIYLQYGDDLRAKKDFTKAKKAIGRLRKRQQSQKAVNKLINSIDTYLKELQHIEIAQH